MKLERLIKLLRPCNDGKNYDVFCNQMSRASKVRYSLNLVPWLYCSLSHVYFWNNVFFVWLLLLVGQPPSNFIKSALSAVSSQTLVFDHNVCTKFAAARRTGTFFAVTKSFLMRHISTVSATTAKKDTIVFLIGVSSAQASLRSWYSIFILAITVLRFHQENQCWFFGAVTTLSISESCPVQQIEGLLIFSLGREYLISSVIFCFKNSADFLEWWQGKVTWLHVPCISYSTPDYSIFF